LTSVRRHSVEQPAEPLEERVDRAVLGRSADVRASDIAKVVEAARSSRRRDGGRDLRALRRFGSQCFSLELAEEKDIEDAHGSEALTLVRAELVTGAGRSRVEVLAQADELVGDEHRRALGRKGDLALRRVGPFGRRNLSEDGRRRHAEVDRPGRLLDELETVAHDRHAAG